MDQLIKLFMVSCMTISFIQVHAQDVIPATGANATGSGGTTSYTIGQVVFSTLTGTSGTMIQGVQQPYEISVVAAVEEAKDIHLTFMVYPNPTSDFLTLKIVDQEIQNMSFRLFDINGNLIETSEIGSSESLINMQNKASGTYFLKIISGKRELKTFKIIKHEFEMKKLFTLLSVIVFCSGIHSQVPEKMSYQAVVRNSNGDLVRNSQISMKISILEGSASGTAVYVETQMQFTNANGLVTLEIGGGTPVTGTIDAIDWSTGIYFLKTETDPNGGTSYNITGTSQLLSVPYALHSKNAENAADKAYVNELKRRLEEMEDLMASQLHPPSDGLIAYYPFNGNAEDESYNGNDGTVVDAIPAINRLGELDCAFRFDGNSGTERYIYANIGKHSTLSVSVWFKSGTPTTMYPNIFTYGSLNRLDFTLLGNHPSYITGNKMGQVQAGAVTGPSFISSVSSEQKYIDDTWHHAVVMFVPNDKIYLYVDNNLAGEAPYTSNNPSDDLFYIGRQIQDNAGSVMHETHFNGSIDDIRIYDRKLTAAEISILYNEDGYPKTLVTDPDGNKYNTVHIGNQVWMAENLKTTKYSNGDPVPYITDNTTWAGLTSGAYCYYNNDASAYKNLYGALYNFYAVTDSRKLCPSGWHVPTDAEWTILTDYLINDGYGYEGSGSDIAKSMAAISGWTSDPTPGNVGNDQASNNSTGLSALPSGHRPFNGSGFGGAGLYLDWWSSTATYYRSIHYAGNSVSRNTYPERGGFAVRCLKD